MIINCPECSTGFKLPGERITPKGTKLKCSRCGHVFRVREGEDGKPEIFYRSHDNKGDGGQEQKPSPGSSPFPHSGGLGGLKPKKKSAFGALSGDENAEEEQEVELTEESEPQIMEEERFEADELEALTGTGSDFGNPEDHVDPSFGDDGPYFDPDEGRVERAGPTKKKRGGGPPPGAAAAGPPPTAAKTAPSTAGAAAPGAPAAAQPDRTTPEASAPAQASAPVDWDDDELAPHNIGGGAGSKIVTVLFLLSLVAFGFFGVVAYQNDGFIDFRNFDQMLEVAFSDGEYEPRDEWGAQGPTTLVVTPEEPVSVDSVYGELVNTAGGDELFVVRGAVRNNTERRVHEVELRSIVSSPEGRALREIAGQAGADVPVGEFRQLRDRDELRDLLNSGELTLEPGRAAPFTLVFDDVPQRVRDGEGFAFRVVVTNPVEEGATMAAQE